MRRSFRWRLLSELPNVACQETVTEVVRWLQSHAYMDINREPTRKAFRHRLAGTFKGTIKWSRSRLTELRRNERHAKKHGLSQTDLANKRHLASIARQTES